MIYIFDGVRTICSLPGMCCKACGDCCAAINCKPIKECCDSCGKGCTHFMEKPLSTFVIVSFILSFVQLYMCNQSFSSECEFPDDASINHSVWVMIEAAFAVINIIFALYFQHKVWNHILERKEFLREVPLDAQDGGMLGGLRGGVQKVRGQFGGGNNLEPVEQPVKESPKIQVKPDSVQASFKEIFLQDFGVLFYFFALIGIFILSYMGKGSVESKKDNCSNEQFVYILGMAFFWVAFLYTFLWYCCKCCAGTVKLDKDEVMNEEMA